MAHYSGKNGRVTSEATVIDGAMNWNVDSEADALDATDYADAGVSDYVPGNSRWSGSFELNFDDSQDISADPPNVNVGEIVALELFISHVTDLKLTGNAEITGVSVTTPQADLVTVTVNFQGKGALTKDFVPTP